jgi:hypothetical protein
LPCQRVHSHLLERAELVPLDLALSDLAIGNANDLDQFTLIFSLLWVMVTLKKVLNAALGLPYR